MGYWDFPTGSDIAPNPVSGGTEAGTAVYEFQPGPADINFAGGLSPYGTMGQGGNVWEWIESAADGSNNLGGEDREIRGGAWNAAGITRDWLNPEWPSQAEPTNEFISFGFRVAMVPEPSSSRFCWLAGRC